MTRILFTNLGYARGIDGTLIQILGRFHRFFYTSQKMQEEILGYLKTIIDLSEPDICCFVEIHQGGRFIGRLNQLKHLVCENYTCFDIANKYGDDNPVRLMPLHRGRSNAFMSRIPYPFERLYFKHGTKRLIYRIRIADDIILLFTHFSLNRITRKKQFDHIRDYLKTVEAKPILLADFNIFQGFSELDSFLADTGMVILNREEDYTFTYYDKSKAVLDLCICPPELAEKMTLKVIDQPFSDHDALLVEF